MTADEIQFEKLLKVMRTIRNRKNKLEEELAKINYRIRLTEHALNNLIRFGTSESYDHSDNALMRELLAK